MGAWAGLHKDIMPRYAECNPCCLPSGNAASLPVPGPSLSLHQLHPEARCATLVWNVTP